MIIVWLYNINMIFEIADIQKQIFNITDEYAKSGILINDLLQIQKESFSDDNSDVPKYHEQFKELAVPTGLTIGCHNSDIQSGGCRNMKMTIDEDIVSVAMFDKLFNNVILGKNTKGSRTTKKNLKSGGKNKTKRSWF